MLFPPRAGRLAKAERRWFNRSMFRAMPLSRLWLLAAVSAIGLLLPAFSRAATHDGLLLAQADAITVLDAWARASPGAATTGAAYVTLKGGAQDDRLVAVSTPVAVTAGVHESVTEDGVMKMRAGPNLPVPAGGTVTFVPGGLHIMLMGLKQPLVAGQSFPLTLTFTHAPAVTVDVKVQPLGRASSASDHGSAH